MQADCKYVSYDSTHYFSKVACDFSSKNELIKPFITDFSSIESFAKKIEQRNSFSCDRMLLHEVLIEQYSGVEINDVQQININKLLANNCFTVTTAHQPNIFTGPLYFIYKIVHALSLAKELKLNFPENHFVPFYYMGSEDADLDELGNFTIEGYKRTWQTKQTGAVGRMYVDEPFLKMIAEVANQINVLPFGKELSNYFETCYVKGTTIQQATFLLVNKLFAEYGLLVLIPDNPKLKSTFNKIVVKELFQQFSHKAVEQTNNKLSESYNIQAAGRDINLFYLIDDKRERIEKIDSFYHVKSLNKIFTESQIIDELNFHPERFSANVILRPVFQETILPNIAFIGGGGELAYWMQLKEVFNQTNTSYPIMVLRNSFLLTNKTEVQKFEKMGFSLTDIFQNSDLLLKHLITKLNGKTWTVENELKAINIVFEQLLNKASAIDTTLKDHVLSILTKTQKKISSTETKMYRAEKRKFLVQQQQLEKIKNLLFPNKNLQERVENFSYYYAKYGKNFISTILDHSTGFKQEFGIVIID